MLEKQYIKSPFNYTGNKIELLPKIEKLFPKNIDTFVDLFGGGANVIANIDFNKRVRNSPSSKQSVGGGCKHFFIYSTYFLFF